MPAEPSPVGGSGSLARQPSNEYAQSFARGLDVIRSFGDARRAMTQSEVAARTGITRATARRLLHTLVELGYASTDGKWFALTPKALDLGFAYLSSTSVWAAAEPVVEELVREFGESSSVSVLEGDDVVYVLRISVARILKSTLGVGSRLPAHVVSMGRIQLAALPDAALDAWLARIESRRYTAWTLVDKSVLRQRILQDREQGWSMVSRELEEGIAGIAVPIRDSGGAVIAAISINLYPAQLEDEARRLQLLQGLRVAAARIGTIAADPGAAVRRRA